jgi:hypothetical protein
MAPRAGRMDVRRLIRGFHQHAECVTFASQLRFTMTMPKTKIATLNLRIDPGLKEAVRQAADREHRSVANMVEMLIRRYCERAGIVIAERGEIISGKHNG